MDYSQFQFNGQNVTIPASYFQGNPGAATNYGGTGTAAWQQLLQSGTTMGVNEAQSFGFLGNLTQGQATQLGALNSTTSSSGSSDANSIVSSMMLPAYANYLSTTNGLNDPSNPNGIAGVSQSNVNSINATNAAANSQIQATTTQGQNQISTQMAANTQQGQNTISALNAAQAAANPYSFAGGAGGNTSTEFALQNKSINDQFNQANAQLTQASTLLAQQGTADQMAANASAASALAQNAQATITNTMNLAGNQLQAAQGVAGVQLQAASFGLQQQQFQLGVQQTNQQLQDTNKQFALDNNIQTPFYSIGGQTYNTQTGQPVQQQQGQQGIPQQQITTVDGNHQLSQQLVTSYAQAYPDAKIDPTQDTIASAQAKIKSSSIYKMALNSGIAAPAKPTGVLATIQTATGLPTATFVPITNAITSYLAQSPTGNNMYNVPQSQRQSMATDVEQSLLQQYPGVQDWQIKPIVDLYFDPEDATFNPYKVTQGAQINVSKPTSATIFSGILQGGSGSGAPDSNDSGFNSQTTNLLQGNK